MLPLHRNDGMEPKRRLAYATKTAQFYRMQIVAKIILRRGQNGRVGRVSRNKTFFFFFGHINSIKRHESDITTFLCIYTLKKSDKV